jgi:CRISPR-associated protein Csd1
MSWIQKLYETYENCQASVGNAQDKIPLVPICHTTQKAHIQIAIDGAGNFRRASVVSKDDARTIIPCTEGSGGRTSGEAAHPLCDKLQYVAADYKLFGGDKKPYYRSYIDGLSKWCASSCTHEKVLSILEYVKKGQVIQDLVKSKILYTDDNGKLLRKWEEAEATKPEIFKLFQGEVWQADAFIRWEVEEPGDPRSKVWNDESIWSSWINYYKSTKQSVGLCYVTGQDLPTADQHPAKIRNDGDKAKLVSSNDLTNFTFRGRFLRADQACGVGFEITQKAHNALRWLIARQGYKHGDQAFVAWAISGARIPDPTMNTLDLFEEEKMRSEISSANSTAQHLANSLSKLIAGYHATLSSTEGIVVMGVDSATPGRMAITFYRELTGSEFLERVQDWHSSCSWFQDYGKDFETNKPKRFVGAPSPREIAGTAYGRRVDEKLVKATVERLLPCIVDGRPIPADIVRSAVRHVSNRIAFEEPWEWNKALGITCAIYKRSHRNRRYEMALEESRNTRDYLFGRLLALADGLESWALSEAGEKRETNATRVMQRFANHPCSTWKNIELSIIPYKARLGVRAVKYIKLMDEVHNLFEAKDYLDDKPLTGEFLLGYHCQRQALRPKEQATDEMPTE